MNVLKATLTLGTTTAYLVTAIIIAGCAKSPAPPVDTQEIGGTAPADPHTMGIQRYAASPSAMEGPASAAASTAAGSSWQEDPPPDGALRAYVWSCADGQKIVMRNLFREKAVAIDLHEGTRRLEQTTSASGVRYEDGAIIFWTKGSTASFERKGSPPVQCTELREESLREDARLQAVR